MSIQRYTLATRSTNLRMSDRSVMDVDWLAAAGACQVNGDALPPQIARLLAGSSDSFWPVVETLERKFGRRSMLDRQAKKQIQDAVWWFLAPACLPCAGKGHRQIADTPHLEDAPCAACNGTTLAPHQHSTVLYSNCLNDLENAILMCSAALQKKIA